MPGLIFSAGHEDEKYSHAVEQLQFDNDYSFRTYHKGIQHTIGANSYPGYPLVEFRSAPGIVLFEGYVYSHSMDSLEESFNGFFTAESWCTDKIQNWVNQADGEFVLMILHQGLQELLILNDRWGRLPVYWFHDGKQLVLSREISFATQIKQSVRAHQQAIASTMLLGYPIGEDTLWEGINRLPPHSIAIYRLVENKIHINSKFQFEAEHHEPNRKVHSDEILHLLQKAILSRQKVLPNPTLSLSGGLDSRLIAGIMAGLNTPSSYATYMDKAGTAAADVSAVEEIINNLKITAQHQFIELAEPNKTDLDMLIRIKQGLNYLGMAFILPYLEHFKKFHRSHITGDGGDKFLTDLRPLLKLSTINQLLSYVLSQHAIMPIKSVAELSGLKQGEILHHLASRFAQYQTDSIMEKYMHFMIRERAMKWLFEGEDRNRYYSWCTSPFYNPDVIDATCSWSMKGKANGALFKELFLKLPGQLQQITNPNWSLSPDNEKAIRRMFWQQKLKLVIPPKLLLTIKGRPQQLILPQFQHAASLINDSDVPSWFNKDFILHAPSFSTEAQWHLITLLHLWRKNS